MRHRNLGLLGIMAGWLADWLRYRYYAVDVKIIYWEISVATKVEPVACKDRRTSRWINRQQMIVRINSLYVFLNRWSPCPDHLEVW